MAWRLLTNGECDPQKMTQCRESNKHGEYLGASRVTKHVLEQGGSNGDVGGQKVFLGNGGELFMSAPSLPIDCSHNTHIGNVGKEIESADDAHGQRQGYLQSSLRVADLGEDLQQGQHQQVPVDLLDLRR